MKKVLVLTPFFYPHTGGSQQYMEELYAEFLKKYSNEFEVEVLTYNTDNTIKNENFRGMHITRISCWNILPGQFAIPNPIELISYLYKNRNSIDLIHSSTRFFDTSWWGPMYAKLINRKSILTDHCAFHPVHPNKLIQFISTTIDIITSAISLPLFTKIYATNNAAKKFLKKKFDANSEVMYGGIDSEVFFPSKNKKENNTTSILFIGRMIDSKGAIYLFNIAKKLPNINFTFAGPGPLEQEFKNEIKEKDIKNIKILGKKTKAEVAELMRNNDILVHPSYHHEGFPNVLTEAGASKMAVIATNVGGSNEIIINDKTGILIEAKNEELLEQKINELVGDKRKQEEYAKNLYTHVTENFSWKKSAEELYKEIQKLTS